MRRTILVLAVRWRSDFIMLQRVPVLHVGVFSLNLAASRGAALFRVSEEQMVSRGKPDHALLSLAADIVSAHVSHNGAPTDGLSDFIRSVYVALATVGTTPAVVAQPEPAVPVNKSVFPDYIVCLEDGKKLKMLRRHLQRYYGLTPEEYRTRWQLPPSYPMVAPNSAKLLSDLAKHTGLGRDPEPTGAADVQAQPISAGRKRK